MLDFGKNMVTVLHAHCSWKTHIGYMDKLSFSPPANWDPDHLLRGALAYFCPIFVYPNILGYLYDNSISWPSFLLDK